MAISTDKIPAYKLLDIQAELIEAKQMVDRCLEYIEEELRCDNALKEIPDCKSKSIEQVDRRDMLMYFRTQRESFSTLVRSQSWAIKSILKLIAKEVDEIEDE